MSAKLVLDNTKFYKLYIQFNIYFISARISFSAVKDQYQVKLFV